MSLCVLYSPGPCPTVVPGGAGIHWDRELGTPLRDTLQKADQQVRNKEKVRGSIVRMGVDSSKSTLVKELQVLLKKQGTGIKRKTAEEFLETLGWVSPWFLQAGTSNDHDWEHVKEDLQKELRKKGPEFFPMSCFLLRLVKKSIVTKNCRPS